MAETESLKTYTIDVKWNIDESTIAVLEKLKKQFKDFESTIDGVIKKVKNLRTHLNTSIESLGDVISESDSLGDDGKMGMGKPPKRIPGLAERFLQAHFHRSGFGRSLMSFGVSRKSISSGIESAGEAGAEGALGALAGVVLLEKIAVFTAQMVKGIERLNQNFLNQEVSGAMAGFGNDPFGFSNLQKYVGINLSPLIHQTIASQLVGVSPLAPREVMGASANVLQNYRGPGAFGLARYIQSRGLSGHLTGEGEIDYITSHIHGQRNLLGAFLAAGLDEQSAYRFSVLQAHDPKWFHNYIKQTRGPDAYKNIEAQLQFQSTVAKFMTTFDNQLLPVLKEVLPLLVVTLKSLEPMLRTLGSFAKWWMAHHPDLKKIGYDKQGSHPINKVVKKGGFFDRHDIDPGLLIPVDTGANPSSNALANPHPSSAHIGTQNQHQTSY